MNTMFFRAARRWLKVGFKELISKLDEGLERLEYLIYKAKRYRKRLYARYLVAYAAGDGFRASMYVSEIVEVERILKLMSRACLSLERSIIRLTTLSEIREFLPVGSMEEGMDEIEKLMDFTLKTSLNIVEDVQRSSIDLLQFTMLDVEASRPNPEGMVIRETAKTLAENLMGEDAILVHA
ncbi:hypothetical protein DRO57_00025 [Candidatus Bathyarchaeota archaeon]|nr:MAG: hypothetical protein DRO57_00025 [Candidatus Bathyarchaeota archaeon]